MSQRSRSSGSQSSHWTDRLIATSVGLGVGLGIAAGTIGVAKLLAPNNDSDAGAVRDVIVLRPRQSIKFLKSDGKDIYSLSICTNSSSDPRASPRDAGSCEDFRNVDAGTLVVAERDVYPVDRNKARNLGTVGEMAARERAYLESLRRQRGL
jgi:hypothetical protein